MAPLTRWLRAHWRFYLAALLCAAAVQVTTDACFRVIPKEGPH